MSQSLRPRIVRLMPVLDFGGVESRVVTLAGLIDFERFDYRVCTLTRAGDAANKLKAEGMSTSDIAERLKIHRNTLNERLRKFRGTYVR